MAEVDIVIWIRLNMSFLVTAMNVCVIHSRIHQFSLMVYHSPMKIWFLFLKICIPFYHVSIAIAHALILWSSIKTLILMIWLWQSWWFQKFFHATIRYFCLRQKIALENQLHISVAAQEWTVWNIVPICWPLLFDYIIVSFIILG